MKHKSFAFSSFKALDEARGEFEAYVAIFGNVDLGGDRIVKGAFASSLQKWASKGRPIPVVFSHQWSNLDAHIGEVLEARETDRGLYVRAQLDMQDPPSAKVWRLLKRGTLAEMSFAYDVIRSRPVGGVLELLELDIIEVGPTLVGMNRETELLSAKGVATAARPSLVAVRAAADLLELGASIPAAPSKRHGQAAPLPSNPAVLAVRVAAELLELGAD